MWAKARNTSNPYRGTLCSYGYILMVIHYLMNVIDPTLVPNLQLSSQPCPGHSKIASFSEYNILFINNEAELERRASYNIKYGNRQSIGKLLRGFFAYYGSRYQMMPPGCFNWVQNVVSIRTQGGIVAKLDKDWNTSRTDEHGHRLRFLVAIEDPFEHNHNVGRTVTDQGLKAITAEFSRARIIIRRVQEIPRVGWEWRTDNGHVGPDLLAKVEFMQTSYVPIDFSSLPNSMMIKRPVLVVSLPKESRTCNRLIRHTTSDMSEKQPTEHKNFQHATLALVPVLNISEGQYSDVYCGVTLDSRQFHDLNATQLLRCISKMAKLIETTLNCLLRFLSVERASVNCLL
ncbi:hypothetical protein BDV23DRAFT_186379 [Aspergillus alliaceus]|uniref:PAP-associated domain-containing protein n=1 Tax=Petromyces alliaceus TaxID=209559 RepID=A0A5N7BZS4_PETAA|nr:hypothetical protein BDV23DRAFT_186379 [Aspergillus alliaceus]